MRFERRVKFGACAVAFAAAVAAGGCDARRAVSAQIVGQLANYFREPGAVGEMSFEKLTDRVWTFRWTWYRNIAVATDEGFVVVDPFNPRAAEALAAELRSLRPDLPVSTVIYTHYHLDHVRGAAALQPREVIAHRKCPQYWSAAEARDVLAPTRFVDGDVDLEVGGVSLRLIHFPNSHSDTLYAVHLPGERLMFAADLGLVRALPPVGVPDRYGPGYLAAMERVAAVDFDRFVPSHFGYGTKEDFLASLGYYRALDRMARRTLEASGGELPPDPAAFKAAFLDNYDALKRDYGAWHGFDEMVLMNVTRALTGALLGY